jgi:hypothetical protein
MVDPQDAGAIVRSWLGDFYTELESFTVDAGRRPEVIFLSKRRWVRIKSILYPGTLQKSGLGVVRIGASLSE